MATKEKAARAAVLNAEAEALKTEGKVLSPELAAELAEDEAEDGEDGADQQQADGEPVDQQQARSAPEPSAADVAEAASAIATRRLQEAENAKNPRPGPGVQDAMDNARKPAMQGSEAVRSRGEPTVTMIFPRAVLLTLGDHSKIEFPVGTQEVPESLSTHQWLKRNGVKAYKK